MVISNKAERASLLLGDLFLFATSLWLMLLLRYAEVPSLALFYDHIVPFSILFVVWSLFYFIAGLYDKHTISLKKKLPSVIFKAQIANIIVAALFFFFIPYFGITPKTNLVIYLVISSILIIFWRLYLFPLFETKKRHLAVLIGQGKEMEELREEVNNNNRYNVHFTAVIDTNKVSNPNDIQKEVLKHVGPGGAATIVTNTKDEKVEPLLPLLYNLSFLQYPLTFIDIDQMYEDIFDRLPLSVLRQDWFLTHLHQSSDTLYDVLKRFLDIAGALVLGLIVLLLLPFIFVAVKLEDGGVLFYMQERMGQFGATIQAYKFRTMERMEHGVWVAESSNRVTKVGSFLRKASLDEFPQFINILKGEMSLIGPRSDIGALADRLRQAIPFYNVRYTVKPGITGWAQVKQQYSPGVISPQSIEESKIRLAYDLYYIKNRSIMLDISIALRTISTLLSRFGVRLKEKKSPRYVS